MSKKVIVIFCLLSVIISYSFSQDMVSGIVNHYLKVASVNTDEITYENNADNTAEIVFFNPGDKVLLIQMTGVELYTSDEGIRGVYSTGTRLNDHNTGRYEILQIDEVDTTNKKVIFTANLLNSYDNGEKIQLVKVFESESNAVINGTLTAKDWDGNSGGVLALIVFDTLKFQGNIDVSYTGFNGALPETGFTGACRTSPDTINFFSYEFNRAGNKGEGTVSTTFPYAKGCYFAATGGGGGNGVFAGGGGGSNYGTGGNGGRQDNSCPSYPELAMGGIGGNDYYNNGCIVMGGGGGAGVESTTGLSSKGGDGGGIVIIAAGIIQSSGQYIYADGEGITGTFMESGGGGGAGGTILIDATGFSGNLNISAKGGRGANTGTNCTGAGGGGGGGVFWYSGTQLPTGYTVDITPGAAGNHGGGTGCFSYGTPGQPGSTYSSLIMPLNGFLFNVIRGKDTICAGQQPKTIIGSNPKGGDGIYTFKWERSPDKNTWSQAIGSGADQRDFTPIPLNTVTYFRRIVTVGGTKPQADTVSKTVEIFVYPAISNNVINGTDTICYNLNALPITGEQPAGGDGTNYIYQWQTSLNTTDWIDAGSELTSNLPYSPGQLTANRYFRRYITSTNYCADSSNSVRVTVLPSIENNLFKELIDTIICQEQTPGILRAEQPTNGDNTYTYLWQKRDVAAWTDIPASNFKELATGSLITTTQYRRVVFSGNDNACIDTSGIKTVTVLNAIASNLVTTDSSRYCEGDVPQLINGSTPSGGAGSGSYSYKWLLNSGSGWNVIAGATGINYSHSAISQSSQIKRVVISGTYDACRDTTAAVNLTVIPAIINNLGLDHQAICENNIPLPFNPPAATGGNGLFIYEWLVRPQGASLWSAATGQNNLAGYSSPVLTDSSSYARKVTSDICTNISEPVNVYVYKIIKNNFVSGSSLKYTCYNSSRVLTGSLPTDGKPNDYNYLWQMSANLTDWTNAAGKTSGELISFETANLTSTEYFRRIVFSPASVPVCYDTSSHATVLLNELPTGSLISSEDTTCEGGSILLKYNVDGIHGPWKVKVGNEMVSDSAQTSATGLNSFPMVFQSSQDVRIISIVDDSLCAADLSQVTGLIKVTVFEIPQANAGENKQICSNQFTLEASKDIAGSTGLWQTSIGTFDNATSENAILTINPFINGVLSGWVKWTETNWRCQDSDSIFLTFYEQPVEIDAGTDKMLNFLFQTSLDAQPPIIGNGKWTISKGNAIFENDTLPNTEIRSLDWDNTLKWTVTNGVCPSIIDSVTILVKDLWIPKGITPGSGTSSQYFKIEIENAERIELTIFNRLGQVVYETPNYTEDNFWDGTKNNMELPEGTYFYILKVKIAGKEPVFGFYKYIELLRK